MTGAVQPESHEVDEWVTYPVAVVTDDAAELAVSFDSDQVVVSFRDWRDEYVELLFTEVAAFRWLDFSSAGVECGSGALCVVQDSSWLAELAGQGRLDCREQPAVHLRADFDLLGVLDVVCAGVTRNPAQ